MIKLGVNKAGYNNSGAVQTLVDPVTNVKGLIIRTASVTTSTTGAQSIMIHTSAPLGVTDANVIHIANSVAGHNTILNDVAIPAGYGVYAASNAGSPNNGVYITYDLL